MTDSVLRLLPLVALSACAAPEPVTLETVPVQEGQSVPQKSAVIKLDDGSDWLRLTSGEWLRGKIKVLDGDKLEFDSKKLDDLELDWSDVAEIHTTRPFTVLLDDQRTLIGPIVVKDGRATVSQEGKELTLSREDLFRAVPGEPEEINYWSGDLSVGMTTRRGNTDQTDLTTTVNLLRHTAGSRLGMDYSGYYSELDGDETADNKLFTSRWDVFLTPRFFATPLGLELYRDSFQNIDWRTTPYAGVGYIFVDTKDVDWDGTVGVGYRVTRFESVEQGEDDKDETGTGIIGTSAEMDLTKDVELDISYQAQVGFDDIDNTNHTLTSTLSVDLWGDLELDVSFQWTRTGQSAGDDSGDKPDQDDFLTTIGVSWEF